MERQFTYVKRFTGQNHLFRDVDYLHATKIVLCGELAPIVSTGKQPEVVRENFLTLYCLQDDS